MRLAPRGWRQHLWPGALALVAVLLVGACGGSTASTARERPDPRFVRVASFDFAESELLGELLAQVLEARGVAVQRRFRLGSREVVQPALEQGLVDVVPEYLASALEFVTLDQAKATAAGPAADELRRRFAGRGVSVLSYAPAVDRNAIAMSASTARQLGVTRVSELAPIASTLDFVGPPDCPERPACIPVLEEKYGIKFRTFTPVPVELITLQLQAGEADVGVAFTSDPEVQDHGLVLLKQDREQPRADNVVPLVRTAVLAAHPGLEVALDAVTARLTTNALRGLNRRVAGGTPVGTVAKDWLRDVGSTS
jgi:osmoprotectant transport system substrate-binding protein